MFDDLSEILRQKQEVLQWRAIAEQAERERLAAENANQRKIEQADVELAHLENTEQALRFQQAVKHNENLVAQGHQLAAALTQEMDEAVKLLSQMQGSETSARLQRLFETQQQHANQAVTAYTRTNTPWPWAGRPMDSLTFEDNRQMKSYSDLLRQQEWQAWQQMQHAWPVRGVIAEWINHAPDQRTRRLRQLVGFVFVGEMLDPSPEYNANLAVAEAQRQNWRP